MRKKTTARAERSKKIKMLDVDINENNETIDEISQEIDRFKKIIRRRRQKHQQHREISLRVVKLKNSKTDIRNKIDALKQVISHIDEKKDEVKLRNKESKKNLKPSKRKPV